MFWRNRTKSVDEIQVVTSEDRESAKLRQDNYALLAAEYLMQKLGIEEYSVDVVDNYQHPSLDPDIVLRVNDLPNWIIYRECVNLLTDEGNLIAEHELGQRVKLHTHSAEDIEWLKLSTYCLQV